MSAGNAWLELLSKRTHCFQAAFLRQTAYLSVKRSGGDNVRWQTDNRDAAVEALSLFMKELLQQIGPDYYRFVQLLIARAELKQLRQWRADVERRSKIPLGMSRALDKSRADLHRNQHFSGGIAIEQLRGPRPRHPPGAWSRVVRSAKVEHL